MANDFPFYPIDFGPLRQPNVFGEVGPQNDYQRYTIGDQAAPSQLTPYGMSPQDEYMARMNDLYSPESVASDKLNSLIQNMPQREQYHPGALRKLGASFVALGRGGIPAAEHATWAPYEHAMTDWESELKPTEYAANLERYANANERALASSTARSDIQERELQRKIAKDKADNEVRSARAATYDYKARHPDHKIIAVPGGYLIAIDPATNKTTHLRDENGNLISSGRLSEEDKIDMQIQGRLDVVDETGAQNRQTEGVKHQNRMGEIQERGKQQKDVKATPSGGQSTKDMLPTQVKVEQYNKARQLFNSHPEYRQWIKLGAPGTNDFQITPPSDSRIFGHRGPDAKTYKEMTDFVYGNGPRQMPGSGSKNTSNLPPAGRVRVIGPNGEKGTVSLEESKKLPPGWRIGS